MSALSRIRISRKRTENAVKAVALAGMIAFGSVGYTYAATNEPAVVCVEETYTVKPGDTFYSICEEYFHKNTSGNNPYFLEYLDAMVELNPWVLERHYQLEVGDKLLMRYWKE